MGYYIGTTYYEGDRLGVDLEVPKRHSELHVFIDGSWTMDMVAARIYLVKKIDADADAIYRDVIGNRTTEYSQAEIDAINYKAANYTGTVPSSVLSWATAKGWTATQACDDILDTASRWRNAQALIRSNRLAKKELAKAAADESEFNSVAAQWAGFVSAIRSQLGI